jgi:hypothetical protein
VAANAVNQALAGTVGVYAIKISGWTTNAISASGVQVHCATASELDLERPGDTGPSYRYRGSLSGDGQRLTGDWAQNGGAKLNAPDKFWKVPD